MRVLTGGVARLVLWRQTQETRPAQTEEEEDVWRDDHLHVYRGKELNIESYVDKGNTSLVPKALPPRVQKLI